MAEVVVVGAGIVKIDDKILITKRDESDDFAHHWEFPGGKRKAEESIQECIKRELLEETKLLVNPIKELAIIPYKYPHKEVEIHFWLCTTNSTDIELNGPSEFKWVDPKLLNSFNFPPANKLLIPIIISLNFQLNI